MFFWPITNRRARINETNLPLKTLLCDCLYARPLPSPPALYVHRRRRCAVSYDHRVLFKRIASTLQGNPCWSLGKMSRKLQVSQRTIEKAIIAASGKTFRELKKGILVERVRSTFASDPTQRIKDVASDLGYKSPRSFARAIKRACGSSPEELRSRIIRDLVAVENTAHS